MAARLLDYFGENKVAWPGQERLARETGVRLNSACEIIARLVDDGLFKVRRRGQEQTNSYKIGTTMLLLQDAWEKTAKNPKLYPELASDIFKQARAEKKRNPRKRKKVIPGNPKSPTPGNPKSGTPGNRESPPPETGKECIPLKQKPSLTEKSIESIKTMESADADPSLNKSPPPFKGKNGNGFVGFEHEVLITEIEEVLGENVALGKGKNYVRGLSDCVNSKLMVAAKELMELGDEPRRFDNDPQQKRALQSNYRLALDQLLDTAEKRKVQTIDGFNEPALWSEAFPDLPMTECYEKKLADERWRKAVLTANRMPVL